MPTSPVTAIVSGASFTVSVTPAALDIDNTILDYLVLEAGALTTNPGNYTKTTAGTVIQYSGVALPAATTLEIRRRTPRVQRNIQAVGTKIRSSDWNAEFDRSVRINEEYDIYGAGGGFSVRLPLDAAFGVAWDGDILFPPTRNAVYDQVILKSNINSPVFTGVPTAPTPSTADSSTTLATTAHVKNNLITLAPLVSPAFTGNPTAPNAVTADNSTVLATTSHVKSNLANYLTLAAAATTYANFGSPAFTGVPTAPTAAALTNTTQLATTAFVTQSSVSRPNLLINGNFNIVQGAPGAITAGTAVPTASTGYAPMQNGWFNYATGGNPTVANVVGSGITLNRLQITGVSGVTLVGVGQRVESFTAAQLANGNATVSVDLANSLGLAVTWTASHPSTTADTFGTVGTPSKTQIATGTFAVTSTLTRFSASFACSDNIRRGLEIVFTVGAQTSGTWTIGDAKIEVGATATAFVAPDISTELVKCMRTHEVSQVHLRGYSGVAGGVQGIIQPYSVRKRTIPTAVFVSEQEIANVSSVSIGPVYVEGFRYILFSTAIGESTNHRTYSFSAQIP